MLKQYRILIMCLIELKKSDLPMIEKLRLEVQLIQTKRLLLDEDVIARVNGVASSEREFRELYEVIKQICSPASEAPDFEGLNRRLLEMKEELKIPLEGKQKERHIRPRLTFKDMLSS